MSDEVWVPEWTTVDMGYREPWRTYDTIKICWHTWEGTNWDAAESSFRPYPPHAGAKIGEGVRQYVPLNHRAYALAGTANERDFVIQIEVAGFAHTARDMSDDDLHWLAEHVLIPILKYHDVPGGIAPPGFHDDQEGLGTIASTHSPIRMSFADWDAFSGHVGHQHAPPPDEHWDPGALNVPRIVQIAAQLINGAPSPKRRRSMTKFFQEKTSGKPVAMVVDGEVKVSYTGAQALHWLQTDIYVAQLEGTLVLPPAGSASTNVSQVWVCEDGYLAHLKQ